MADNVSITAGTGTSIAADDVSGVFFQKVKIDGGGDGLSAPIFGDSTNGLDVDVTRMSALVAGTANIGDVDVASIAAGDNNIGNVDVVSLPALTAGEAHLGSAGSPDIVITIDATPDTSALSDGDVAFATQEVAGAARVNGGTIILQNIIIADPDDQGAGIDLIFFNANTTLGAENSAPDIDDTEVQTIIGRVQIGSGSFYDLGTNRIACVTGIGLLMKADVTTTSIYVAGIARGTPTYSGGHLYIKLGFMRN